MDLETVSSEIVFIVGMILLGALNINTYPYMPVNGVLLTLFFLSLSSIVVVQKFLNNRSTCFFWILFTSFNLTVLFCRVFVNTTGIGTPRSTGNMGPLTVQQLWIEGIHIHHYWLGLLLLPVAFYMVKKQFSKIRIAAVLGTGIALVVDELGIILVSHTYHSSVSYISLAVVNTILFLMFFRSENIVNI